MKKINWPDQILNFFGIIIGVSLAFFINNASQKNQEKNELNLIINSFISELNQEINTYEQYSIPKNKRKSALLDTLLLSLQQGKFENLNRFKEAIGYSNYSPSNTTFKSISSTGKLNLIKDFELRKQIINFHTVYTVETQHKNDQQVKYHSEHIIPFIIDNIDLTNPDMRTVPVKKLKSILIFYQILLKEKIKSYQVVIDRGKELNEKLLKLEK